MPSPLLSLARRLGLTGSRCPVCGTATKGENGILCTQCAAELRPREKGYCPQCGAIFGDDESPPTRCARCRLDPPPWDTLHFHSAYSGILRRLILGYKFNGHFGRNTLLATLAEQAYRHEGTAPDIIVPVPLHPRRLIRRGFNQSLELSRILGDKLGVPVLKNGLKRIRHTPPQTRLDRAQRLQNIKDAFEADRSIVSGRFVLLVDDVYTTGSTLSECARTLRRARAASIDVLVLARAREG